MWLRCATMNAIKPQIENDAAYFARLRRSNDVSIQAVVSGPALHPRRFTEGVMQMQMEWIGWPHHLSTFSVYCHSLQPQVKHAWESVPPCLRLWVGGESLP